MQWVAESADTPTKQITKSLPQTYQNYYQIHRQVIRLTTSSDKISHRNVCVAVDTLSTFIFYHFDNQIDGFLTYGY